MAKIINRRLHWAAPVATDVIGYDVYVTDAADDSAAFLAMADTGQIDPAQRVGDPEYFPDQPEGNYQYCVIAVDDAGNESDPYQHTGWVNVPLDVTPPDAPSGGGIDFVTG